MINNNRVLDLVSPQSGDIFYDLGAGKGRALVAADILYPGTFSKLVGIELVEGYLDDGFDLLKQYSLYLSESKEVRSHGMNSL